MVLTEGFPQVLLQQWKNNLFKKYILKIPFFKGDFFCALPQQLL